MASTQPDSLLMYSSMTCVAREPPNRRRRSTLCVLTGTGYLPYKNLSLIFKPRCASPATYRAMAQVKELDRPRRRYFLPPFQRTLSRVTQAAIGPFKRTASQLSSARLLLIPSPSSYPFDFL
ncbi:hypothetical protein PMIN03_012658 [Paraphaeosphaeria minitans]